MVIYREPGSAFIELKGLLGIVQESAAPCGNCEVKWMYRTCTDSKKLVGKYKVSYPSYNRIDVIQDEELKALVILSMMGD